MFGLWRWDSRRYTQRSVCSLVQKLDLADSAGGATMMIDFWIARHVTNNSWSNVFQIDFNPFGSSSVKYYNQLHFGIIWWSSKNLIPMCGNNDFLKNVAICKVRIWYWLLGSKHHNCEARLFHVVFSAWGHSLGSPLLWQMVSCLSNHVLVDWSVYPGVVNCLLC